MSPSTLKAAKRTIGMYDILTMDTYNCGDIGKNDTDWPDYIEDRLILCPDHISLLNDNGSPLISLMRTKFFYEHV